MKTVMKKMFCLMLVAVLMVGVMPFQAFAAAGDVVYFYNIDGTAPMTSITMTGDALTAAEIATVNGVASANGLAGWTSTMGSLTIADLSTITGVATLYGVPATVTCTNCGTVYAYNASHTPGTDCCLDCHSATGHNTGCIVFCDGTKDCPNPVGGNHNAGCPGNLQCSICSERGHLHTDCPTLFCACGSSLASGLHTPECVKNCKNDRTCTSINHNPGCEGHLCDTPLCTVEESVAHTEHTGAPCSDSHCQKYLGHSGKHSYLCPEPGCDKPIHTGEHNLACSTANCALKLGHAGEHKCACGLLLQKSSAHNASCPFYEAVVINNPNNTYSLKVWAKLWVGETLQKTILLDTITGLNGTEVVPYVIGDNVARLESKFPAGYKNIEWTKAVYFMIDSTKSGTVDTNMNVNEEDNVYINLYSQEKLVVARVHTAKTYGIDRSVQVGGFRPGDVVTHDDVLKAVSKYYNVSSMKMYTYGEWEKVVAGGEGSAIPNFVVQGGDNDNVYEVYITGTYKSTGTSTTYKADSTNPKTGDAIFAPIMVLGLSASALAVLFYLNKKRAF